MADWETRRVFVSWMGRAFAATDGTAHAMHAARALAAGDPAEVAVAIPEQSTLINQAGMTVDREGRPILHTEPAKEDAAAPAQPALTGLIHLDPVRRFLALYQAGGVYETALPLLLDGEPFGDVAQDVVAHRRLRHRAPHLRRGTRDGVRTKVYLWGAAHPVRFEHPLLRFVPGLGALTRIATPTPGDGETVNRAGLRAEPEQRRISVRITDPGQREAAARILRDLAQEVTLGAGQRAPDAGDAEHDGAWPADRAAAGMQ